MLVFSAAWAAVAFALTPAELGRYRTLSTAVFGIAGLLAGIEAHWDFGFFRRRTGNPITAFWLVLPVNLAEGAIIGLASGMFTGEILSRITNSERGWGGALFGMAVGLLASFISYILWRLVVKWVWR